MNDGSIIYKTSLAGYRLYKHMLLVMLTILYCKWKKNDGHPLTWTCAQSESDPILRGIKRFTANDGIDTVASIMTAH